jgi:hypothetical protein
VSEHDERCDGMRIAHRLQRETEGRHMYRLVCEECGGTTGWLGWGVSDGSARRLLPCVEAFVDCDGRCREWAA